MAYSFNWHWTDDEEVIEALYDKAMAWAAYIASQSNYQPVIFEGDSLTCITAVLSNGTNVPWRIKNAIQEIIA